MDRTAIRRLTKRNRAIRAGLAGSVHKPSPALCKLSDLGNRTPLLRMKQHDTKRADAKLRDFSKPEDA